MYNTTKPVIIHQEDDEEEEVADNNDEVSINGCGGGKIDIHTHILPQDWPSIEGFDLRIVDLPKDDDIGRKAGFIKRMEWVNTTNASSSVPPGEGKLFRKVKSNCIDPNIVIEECDRWGVNVQTVCTVPVLFNYHSTLYYQYNHHHHCCCCYYEMMS
mmetsp:Transcript_15061/g.12537  ORF Transcript_15061/g.12537 Transcript_15061/m.12537 type:complete len:157 (-) Transcript_15061:27-497(-)